MRLPRLRLGLNELSLHIHFGSLRFPYPSLCWGDVAPFQGYYLI